MNKGYLITLISGIIIGILVSTMFTCDRQDPVIKYEERTVTVHDTIKEFVIDTFDREVPIYIEVTDPTKIDTVYLTKGDTTIKSYFDLDDTLFNGVITAYAGCTVDKLDIEGNFINKEIHRTDSIFISQKDSIFVTKTVKDKSFNNFYLSTGVGIHQSTLVEQDFNLYYTNNKLLLGAGIGYNNLSNDIFYKASIGVKLFNKKTKNKQ